MELLSVVSLLLLGTSSVAAYEHAVKTALIVVYEHAAKTALIVASEHAAKTAEHAVKTALIDERVGEIAWTDVSA